MRFTKRLAVLFVAHLCCLFLLTSFAVSETVRVLRLSGEGTAIVYVSDNTHKALITDGGKRGAAGLAKTEIEGKSVLRWLRDRGVTFLVIECSHPDSDHLDALVEIVRGDPTIREFDEVHFVDSGFRKGNKNASKSLYEHYQEAQANEAKQPKIVKPHSAENGNAFEGLFDKNDEIYVRNFRYQPAEDAPVHGHTIVTELTVRHAGSNGALQESAVEMVDPDDANSKLVKMWAEAAAAQGGALDVFIVPHHGSDGTDIGPILALKPKACIFTVNANNQYGHPSPRNLWKCIDALGINNVHITAGEGDVVFTAEMLKPVGESEKHSDAFSRAVRPSMSRCERDLATYEELAASRPLTSAERSKLARLAEDHEAYLKIQKAMTGRDAKKKQWVALALGPDGGGGTIPPGPTDDDPPAFDSKNPHDGPGGGGGFPENTGDFRQKISDLNEAIETNRERQDQPPNKPRAGEKTRFDRSFETEPVFGGISLGNHIQSAPAIKDARIELIRNRLTIIVRCEGGPEGAFSETSNTELLSAYQFVSPPEDVVNAFSLQAEETSLLGSEGPDKNGGYQAAIHPAIANTLIARDGLRLDMLLFAVTQHAIENGHSLQSLSKVKLPAQWYDDKAVITVSDQMLRVEASDGPKEILLRLRSWAEKTPSWLVGAQDREDAIEKEQQRRLAKLADEDGVASLPEYRLTQIQQSVALEIATELVEKPTWLSGKSNVRDAMAKEMKRRYTAAVEKDGLQESSAYKLSTAITDAMQETTNAEPAERENEPAEREKLLRDCVAKKVEAAGLSNDPNYLFFHLLGQLSSKGKGEASPDTIEKAVAENPNVKSSGLYKMYRFRLRQEVVSREVESEVFGNEFLSTEVLNGLYANFEPFQRIERFAKAVTVLRWLKAAGKLPAVPPDVARHLSPIAPAFTQQDVDNVFKELMK